MARFTLVFLLLMIVVTPCLAAGISYQGQLRQAGSAYSGSANLSFFLFDSVEQGSQIGPPQNRPGWPISNGLFQVELDFGPGAFDGSERWLEVWVNGIALTPRQKLTAAPLAQHALNVPAESLSGLGCQAGQVPLFSGSNWLCADQVGSDTLGELSCASGQLAKWSGMAWHCADDNDTVYSAGAGVGLAGTEFFVQGSGYANVRIVAQQGGDFDSVQSAIDSITDASAENPWLIWIAPGVYPGQVVMKPFVSLQGAGEDLTILRGFGGEQAPPDGGGSATLLGSSQAQISELSVESDGSNQSYAIAIYNNEQSPSMRNLTVRAWAATNNHGIHNRNGSAPKMLNLAASASAGLASNIGIVNTGGSSPHMSGIRSSAQGIVNSATYAVNNSLSSSPTIRSSTLRTQGGWQGAGLVSAADSAPLVIDSQISSINHSGNAWPILVDNASLELVNVLVEAEAGNSCYALYSNLGTVDILSSRFFAGNCAGTTSAMIAIDSEVTARGSVFAGTTLSVYSAPIPARVAYSQLIGPLSETWPVTCLGNFDEDLNPVICPQGTD